MSATGRHCPDPPDCLSAVRHCHRQGSCTQIHQQHHFSVSRRLSYCPGHGEQWPAQAYCAEYASPAACRPVATGHRFLADHGFSFYVDIQYRHHDAHGYHCPAAIAPADGRTRGRCHSSHGNKFPADYCLFHQYWRHGHTGGYGSQSGISRKHAGPCSRLHAIIPAMDDHRHPHRHCRADGPVSVAGATTCPHAVARIRYPCPECFTTSTWQDAPGRKGCCLDTESDGPAVDEP